MRWRRKKGGGLRPFYLVLGRFALVGFLHESAGLVDGSLGVVVGLDGEAVFIDGAVALAGDVEDVAELDVAPDLDPLGIAVSTQGIAEGVGRGLVVALHEEDLADAVGRQRAVAVGVESLLVLDETGGEVALSDLLLAAKDGDADGEVGRALEEPVLRVDGDAARAAEGFDGEVALGAGDIDAADLGLAVGFDAELYRHAEEVEVLCDGADGAEALVVAEAEDGVLVGEGGGSGAVAPLSEEGRELELRLGLGYGLDVGGADALVGVLGEEAAEELEEGVIAHLPTEHVEDHRTLLEGHGLELGGEGVEAAYSGERLGVVGEGSGLDVGDGRLEGRFSGGVFDEHQLGVAGHAVGDPGVVEGGGGDLAAPPLVGEGVGEEAGVGLSGDARAGEGGDLGGPCGGDGVGGKLDEVDLSALGLAEGGGHELELLGGVLSEGNGGGFVGLGDVDVDVADAGGDDGLDELAGDDGSGEAGLGPLEGVLGAVAGEALGSGDAGAGADDALVTGDANVHLGGKAVGVEADHGEPASGVEQDADGVLDGGEVDAFDGAGLGSLESAGVLEGPGGGDSLGDGGGKVEAHGGVGGDALGFKRLFGRVGDLGELEAVIELEDGSGEVFEGGEGDRDRGGELVVGGVEVGVDDVAGDLKRYARRRGPDRRREEKEGNQGCKRGAKFPG